MSGLPITELAWDTVLSALTFLGASDLSASSESSRLLFLLVREAQRRPSVVTEVGEPSKVLAALGQRLSATPTLGFLFSTGSLQEEIITKILCTRLPPSCELIGAQTQELQALVAATERVSDGRPDAESPPLDATVLRNVRERGHVAVMLGSFPYATARSFYLSPVVGNEIVGCSDDASALEMLRQKGLPCGDEWKTIVLIVSSVGFEMDPERLLQVFQQGNPNTAVLGGVAGKEILLHSRGRTHVQSCGVVGLALKGNVPLTALVSRGAKPLTPSMQASGATVEGGSMLIPRLLADTAGTEISPIDMVIQAQRATGGQFPMFVGVRCNSNGGYKLHSVSQDLFEGGGAMRLNYDESGSGCHSLSDCAVRFYQLDPDESRSDLKNLLSYVKQRAIEDNDEVLGSIMFTCGGRSMRFFNESNVDMKQFQHVFPSLPLVGLWAGGEIGPQAFAESSPSEATRTGNAAFQGFTAVFGVFRAPKETSPHSRILSMGDEQLPNATGEVFAGLANDAKERGNSAFKEGLFNEASEHYKRASELAGVPSAGQSPQNQAILLSNRAMARLKVEDFASALTDSAAAIALDPLNVKAVHRHGQALIGLKRPTDAVAYLQGFCGQLETKELGLEQLLARAQMLAERQEKRKNQKAGYPEVIEKSI